MNDYRPPETVAACHKAEQRIEHHIADWTEADWNKVSYYTLCKLSDQTKFVYPHKNLKYGVLTLDGFGNFISYEEDR